MYYVSSIFFTIIAFLYCSNYRLPQKLKTSNILNELYNSLNIYIYLNNIYNKNTILLQIFLY